MVKPAPKELVDALGISPSYASMILSGERIPPPGLAAAIFAKLNLKMGIFKDLSDEDAETAARIHGAKAA